MPFSTARTEKNLWKKFMTQIDENNWWICTWFLKLKRGLGQGWLTFGEQFRRLYLFWPFSFCVHPSFAEGNSVCWIPWKGMDFAILEFFLFFSEQFDAAASRVGLWMEKISTSIFDKSFAYSLVADMSSLRAIQDHSLLFGY